MKNHSPSLLRGFILLAFLLFPQLIASSGPSECFFLDGSAATDHQPCIPAGNRSETTHSTCCIVGQPAGNSKDICTSQGLCYAQQSSSSVGFLFQGGCTDSSLADESCRSPCAPSNNGTKYFAIVPCSNGQFCCSAQDGTNAASMSCCSGSTFPVNLSLALQATSSATSVTPSTQPTSSATPSTQPTSLATQAASSPDTCLPAESSSHNTTSCPKDKTAVVGASIGAVLGSMLLAALVTIILLWRKLGQKRLQYLQYQQRDHGSIAKNYPMQDSPNMTKSILSITQSSSHTTQSPPHIMQNSSPITEGRTAYEVDGQGESKSYEMPATSPKRIL